MVKEYLKNHILVADGAMGTYYSQVVGNHETFSEMANISSPEIILDIHKQYIKAGAKLIRTNTFSANTITLGCPHEEVEKILINGYQIAERAASGGQIFIAADIGPIPETMDNHDIPYKTILEEYKFIVDIFLRAGAKIFIFETFSSTDYLAEISEYIKKQNNDAFIIAQFVIMVDGYTRKGSHISKIVGEVKNISHIDLYGFNCGTGPTHLYNNIKKIDFSNDYISVLPNAGFPEIINERTIYSADENYFADKIMEFVKLGVKMIGGCCGTTPTYIKKISEKLLQREDKNYFYKDHLLKDQKNQDEEKKTVKENEFLERIRKNQFVITVELAPPFDSNTEKLLEGAKKLKAAGVDAITISDSPLARVRVNSIMTAAKIKREVGIDTIPHICCRDRNIIALKSDLLAAHMEGIRNILIVTGDPIPSPQKSEIRSVFNLNSIKLMQLVDQMNKEQFVDDSYCIGGALNLNVVNKQHEFGRMIKKIDAGATFFLTQPIYDETVIEYLASIKRSENIKILGGIMPIVSYKNALFLNNEVPGIRIPEKYISRFHKDMARDEAEETGIQIAVDIANQIKEYVDGFYFIVPFNRVDMIIKIIEQIQAKN